MVERKHNIGPYVDAVGIALGRKSALQVIPPPPAPRVPHYKTPIKGDVFPIVDRRRWMFVAKRVV